MKDIQRLATLALQVRRARQLLHDLEALRDEAINELHASGVRPAVLIEASGLARPTFYRALTAPKVASYDDDPFAAEDAFALFEQDFEQRWDEALAAWHQSGGDGEPADYFPLGGLIDARP